MDFSSLSEEEPFHLIAPSESRLLVLTQHVSTVSTQHLDAFRIGRPYSDWLQRKEDLAAFLSDPLIRFLFEGPSPRCFNTHSSSISVTNSTASNRIYTCRGKCDNINWYLLSLCLVGFAYDTSTSPALDLTLPGLHITDI